MKDYTFVLTMGIDATRDGHADFIADEIIDFAVKNYGENVKDYRYVLWNDKGEPIIEGKSYAN